MHLRESRISNSLGGGMPSDPYKERPYGAIIPACYAKLPTGAKIY